MLRNAYWTLQSGNGLVHSARVLNAGGRRTLYAGLVPTLIRAFPANAAQWLAWELSRRYSKPTSFLSALCIAIYMLCYDLMQADTVSDVSLTHKPAAVKIALWPATLAQHSAAMHLPRTQWTTSCSTMKSSAMFVRYVPYLDCNHSCSNQHDILDYVWALCYKQYTVINSVGLNHNYVCCLWAWLLCAWAHTWRIAMFQLVEQSASSMQPTAGTLLNAA